jgi:flagellar motor switch protein FliN/FliY
MPVSVNARDMSLAKPEIDATTSAPASPTEARATDTPPVSGSSSEPRSVREPAETPEELRRILHLSVPIIVTLAEREMPVGSVLKLNTGSILEFDRPADAEMELRVNNQVIGRGLPVKVGENFGLRLTTVGSLFKTIEALGR